MDRLFNNPAWTRMGMKECARLNPRHPESHRHVLDIPMPPPLAGSNDNNHKSLGTPTAGEFCLGYILHKNRQAIMRKKKKSRLAPKKKIMSAPVTTSSTGTTRHVDREPRRPAEGGGPRRKRGRKPRNDDRDLFHFFDPGRRRRPQPPPSTTSNHQAEAKRRPRERATQARFKPSGVLVVEV
jgi:hypothetical protein